MKLRAATPEDMAWAQEKIGALTSAAKGIAAIRADGSVAAVVAYDMWTQNAVWMHVAVATAAACRPLLRAAFAYPFIEAGLRIALAMIPSHRWKAVRMAKRLGFIESHRIPDGWALGSDLVCFEMRKERCRFLQPQRRRA